MVIISLTPALGSFSGPGLLEGRAKERSQCQRVFRSFYQHQDDWLSDAFREVSWALAKDIVEK